MARQQKAARRRVKIGLPRHDRPIPCLFLSLHFVVPPWLAMRDGEEGRSSVLRAA